MKTKDIQELYQIKLHSMDTILHQISLMDQVEMSRSCQKSFTLATGNWNLYRGRPGICF